MSIRWLVLFATTILASLFSPVPATAAVIFDNGAPSGENAFFSDADPTGQNPFPVQRADDFSLAPGGTTITDVHWFGAYALTGTPPASDNFTIQIFDNLATGVGGPLNLLHTIPVGDVGRVDTGVTIGSFTMFSYAAIISPITLSSGTTYWLSILNSTTNDPDDNWAWASVVEDAGNSRARFLTTPLPLFWSLQEVELAFSLTDDTSTVPEPSTLLLLGSGLAGVAAWRRRRR